MITGQVATSDLFVDEGFSIPLPIVQPSTGSSGLLLTLTICEWRLQRRPGYGLLISGLSHNATAPMEISAIVNLGTSYVWYIYTSKLPK